MDPAPQRRKRRMRLRRGEDRRVFACGKDFRSEQIIQTETYSKRAFRKVQRELQQLAHPLHTAFQRGNWVLRLSFILQHSHAVETTVIQCGDELRQIQIPLTDYHIAPLAIPLEDKILEVH